MGYYRYTRDSSYNPGASNGIFGNPSAGDDVFLFSRNGNFVSQSSSQGTRGLQDNQTNAIVTVDSGLFADFSDNRNHVNLNGGNVGDVLYGGSGADQFNGAGGNDVLAGGAGADLIDGGTGDDIASYLTATTGVYASLSNPNANTGDASGDTFTSVENLTGSAFNDTLVGDGNRNVLDGGAGDDVLIAIGNFNLLVGGAGTDTAMYAEETRRIYVDLSGVEGDDTVPNQGDVFISVENAVGSAFDDRLVGDGGSNIFTGGGGADALVGNGGVDIASYADATTGVNASLRSPGTNTGDAEGDTYDSMEGLIGSSYADRLVTSAADQSLDGGAGKDKLFVYGAPSLVDGGAGTDTLYISAQDPLVFAAGSIVNVEAITVREGANADFSAFANSIGTITSTSTFDGFATIVGTGGDDKIYTGRGADIIDTGIGNDRIYVSSYKLFGDQPVYKGGDGTDTLILRAGNGYQFTGDSLVGVEKVLIPDVDNGSSTYAYFGALTTGLTITSEMVNAFSTIIGTSGDDRITSGGGDDVVTGGLGADRLSGGAGADQFSYASGAEMTGDKILNFSQADGDTIYVYGASTAFDYLGADAFSGDGQSEVRLEAQSGTSYRFAFDIDGDGSSDGSLFVQSAGPIDAGAFLTNSGSGPEMTPLHDMPMGLAA